MGPHIRKPQGDLLLYAHLCLLFRFAPEAGFTARQPKGHDSKAQSPTVVEHVWSPSTTALRHARLYSHHMPVDSL